MAQQQQEQQEQQQTAEYMEITDPISQKKVTVPKDMQELIGHLVSFNRQIGREPAEAENSKLKKQIEDMNAKLQEISEKGKDNSDLEKMKSEFQKVISELNEKADTMKTSADEWRKKYIENQRLTDIQTALSQYDVHNRGQVAEILKARSNIKEVFNVETGEKTGVYQTTIPIEVADEKGNIISKELPAGEAVKAFFENESNQFHLKNPLRPGGGTSSGNDRSGMKKQMSRKNFEGLLPTEQMAAIKEGTIIKD